jgi:hypothetical protein
MLRGSDKFTASARASAFQQRPRKKPRNFTSAEAVLDEVRERIFMDGRTYKELAYASNVSPTGNADGTHITRPTTCA